MQGDQSREIDAQSTKLHHSNSLFVPTFFERWRWWLAGAGLVVVIVAAGLVYYYHPSSHRPSSSGYFPDPIRSQVKTALYYPTHPPSGMQVDRTSFHVPTKNVVTYTVSDSQDNKFYVSIEPIPDNFDFIAFKKKFQTTDDLNLPTGNGFIGDLGAQLVASIQTQQNSWIIINTKAVTQAAELQSLARSLVETK